MKMGFCLTKREGEERAKTARRFCNSWHTELHNESWQTWALCSLLTPSGLCAPRQWLWATMKKITDQYCLDFKLANDHICLYRLSRGDTTHLIRMADLSAICCLSSVHPSPAFVTGKTTRVQYLPSIMYRSIQSLNIPPPGHTPGI